MILLECVEVTKFFGGLAAVKNVHFRINKGEILGLIGPNGAGKTTLFNLITGVYKPDSGIIKFKGENIAGLKPHEICRRGIGRTFQIPKPFKNMTVFDNIITGIIFGKKSGIKVGEARKRALEVINFVGLSGKEDLLPGSLTIADLKRLEMAKALATKPEIILLDEVVAGLNPAETLETIELIKKIRKELGVTIFMIEHVMKAIMNICDRIMVLHHGEKIAEGTPHDIATSKRIIEVYLGE